MVTEHVKLSDEQADFIRRSIEAGNFADVSEVVQTALRLLEESEKAEFDLLRAEIQKGLDDIEAGRYIELNSDEDFRANREEIRRRGHEILAKEAMDDAL